MFPCQGAQPCFREPGPCVLQNHVHNTAVDHRAALRCGVRSCGRGPNVRPGVSAGTKRTALPVSRPPRVLTPEEPESTPTATAAPVRSPSTHRPANGLKLETRHSYVRS